MRANERLPKVSGMLLIASVWTTGCGVAPEVPHVAYSTEPERTIPKETKSIDVPDTTARELQSCVNAVAGRWSGPSHAFQYDLSSNEKGVVQTATLRDTTFHDSTLEACFTQVLSKMRVPEEALRLRIAKPFSGGENKARLRGDVGVVQAVAAPIALAPIALAAAGVVILVAVAVHVIDDATAERERCKRVLEFCIAKCTEEAIPSGSPSGDPFFKCRKECLDAANCWGVKLY